MAFQLPVSSGRSAPTSWPRRRPPPRLPGTPGQATRAGPRPAGQQSRYPLERCGGVGGGPDVPRTPLLPASSRATISLTHRELEIAQPAAHGLPRREIAERLHGSVRTVQNHLQRVHTKLGVTSRGELTRALATGLH